MKRTQVNQYRFKSLLKFACSIFFLACSYFVVAVERGYADPLQEIICNGMVCKLENSLRGTQATGAFVWDLAIPGRTYIFNPADSVKTVVEKAPQIMGTDFIPVLWINPDKFAGQDITSPRFLKFYKHEHQHFRDSLTPPGLLYEAIRMKGLTDSPEWADHAMAYSLWTELRAYTRDQNPSIAPVVQQLANRISEAGWDHPDLFRVVSVNGASFAQVLNDAGAFSGNYDSVNTSGNFYEKVGDSFAMIVREFGLVGSDFLAEGPQNVPDSVVYAFFSSSGAKRPLFQMLGERFNPSLQLVSKFQQESGIPTKGADVAVISDLNSKAARAAQLLDAVPPRSSPRGPNDRILDLSIKSVDLVSEAVANPGDNHGNVSFPETLGKILEAPSGTRVKVNNTTHSPGSTTIGVTLTDAELKAMSKNNLASVPDRFSVIDPGVGPTNPGITLELNVDSGLLKSGGGRIKTISSSDLVSEIMADGITGGGWSFNPRNPLSIGDAAYAGDYLGISLDPNSPGAKTEYTLRGVLKTDLKVPSSPAESVVDRNATLLNDANLAATSNGGSDYTGDGNRVRVVQPDGTVTEFPALRAQDYTTTIGTNVGFIDVTNGTPAGDALVRAAGQVPADVYAGYQAQNPVAANQFARAGVNEVLNEGFQNGNSPTIGGLPVVALAPGGLVVGRPSAIDALGDAYFNGGWDAHVKAAGMVNDLFKPQAGFGLAGMTAAFTGVQGLNTIVDAQVAAIASGNYAAYDDSYRVGLSRLPDQAINTLEGIAVFEGLGIGAGALTTAGATLTAGGATGLGAAFTTVGTGASIGLSATGVGFVAVAIGAELNEAGKVATLMNQIDAQAAQVGMVDDSWAYSDNPVYRQMQVDSEFYTHLIGGGWNAAVDSVKGIPDGLLDVAKGLMNPAHPPTTPWPIDDTLGGSATQPSSSANMSVPGLDMDWMGYPAAATTYGMNQLQTSGNPPPTDGPLFEVPPWIADLAKKGSQDAKALAAALDGLHWMFPDLVGSPTSRGDGILTSPGNAPSSVTSSATRLPGVVERMQDAIEKMNTQATNAGYPAKPTDPTQKYIDDLYTQLGSDPANWLSALDQGIITMDDLADLFTRINNASPQPDMFAPRITVAPVNTTVVKGQPLTLSVQAQGNNLHYVWTHNGKPISGIDNATLTVQNTDSNSAGAYAVYVSDGKLMIGTPPVRVTVFGITVPPAPSTTVGLNKSVTLSVTVDGGDVKYQWKKDGAEVAGATASTITLPSMASSNIGTYTVVVSLNGVSTTSNPAVVNLVEFLKDPSFKVAVAGTLATIPTDGKITLASGNKATPSYQWYKAGVIVPGQTTAVLTLKNSKVTDTGDYTVRVIDASGFIESEPAHLEVLAPTFSTVSLTNSPNFSCSVGTGSVLTCSESSGSNKYGETSPSITNGILSLSLGVQHGCSINNLNRVSCWGDSSKGQTKVPTDLKNVVAVSDGPTYSCALLADSTVRCWGTYTSGGTTPGINQVIKLVSSVGGTCATLYKAQTICWGP